MGVIDTLFNVGKKAVATYQAGKAQYDRGAAKVNQVRSSVSGAKTPAPASAKKKPVTKKPAPKAPAVVKKAPPKPVVKQIPKPAPAAKSAPPPPAVNGTYNIFGHPVKKGAAWAGAGALFLIGMGIGYSGKRR